MAKVLGEDIFGSPKPHPNAVLNLFEAQNVRFAIPFAAYRASIGGISVLMSDEPGTILPRHTLATTIHGMHVIQSLASDAARMITYGESLPVCPDELCLLNFGIDSVETTVEVLEKIYDSMIDEREGGVLTPPSLEHLLCLECTNDIEVLHAPWRSFCWMNLTSAFAVSDSWDDL